MGKGGGNFGACRVEPHQKVVFINPPHRERTLLPTIGLNGTAGHRGMESPTEEY